MELIKLKKKNRQTVNRKVADPKAKKKSANNKATNCKRTCHKSVAIQKQIP